MTLTNEERTALIKYRIERARSTEDEVSFLIENNKLHLAVNRIYYGSFYILSALALKYRFQTSKHAQLIGWFNKEFIKENVIDRKYGQYLHKAYDKRAKGDYADYITFDKDEVSILLAEMIDFRKKVEELIEKGNLESVS
jgi:uncharacterized protein (UPF0332 family)